MILCENDFEYKCPKCNRNSIERNILIKSTSGNTISYLFRAHSACLSSDKHNDRLKAAKSFINKINKLEDELNVAVKIIELDFGEITHVYFATFPSDPCDDFGEVMPYVSLRVSGRIQEFNLERTKFSNITKKSLIEQIIPIANEITIQMKSRIDRGTL